MMIEWIIMAAFFVYVTTIDIIVLPGSSRNALPYTFISTGNHSVNCMINNQSLYINELMIQWLYIDKIDDHAAVMIIC